MTVSKPSSPRAAPIDIDIDLIDDPLPDDIANSSHHPRHFPTPTPAQHDVPAVVHAVAPQTDNIVHDMTRFREHPMGFLKTLLDHVRGSKWRAYDNYVGQELYIPGLTEFMKQTTMANEGLRQKIVQLAELQLANESADFSTEEDKLRRKEELQSWLESQAEALVDEMTVSYDYKAVLRFMYYTVAQIFHRTYHQGVHVDRSEIERLREKARELEKKRQSIVFLPCHKSHIDYMSIQFICFRTGISLPTVVAGDNLNFAVIGPMLRQVGAMWIRRSFSDDKMYNNTMQAYIETLLSNGFNFECFIEGTRSRTGKLLPPKYGILKFILEAVLSGRVEDCWILPVSTQYDKVAEAESYATELLGRDKKKENFFDFINARKIMSLQMGRVDVRFHKGWSFREYVVGQVNKELVRSALDAELNLNTIDPKLITGEMHKRLLRSLGYRVLADINQISVVMPTSLIGTMLLTLRGRGIGKQDLVRRVSWFIGRIQQRGGRVGNFNHPTIEHLVENGLDVLGPDLVGEVKKNLLETTYFAKDPFKLSYYRNQVIHLFVSEAIVCAAIYSKFQQPQVHQQQQQQSGSTIKYSELLERVQFLSQLLSGEFVFGPEGIQTNLAQTLADLVAENVLAVEVDTITGEKLVSISDAEVEHGKEVFEFYCFLVWPFLDGFWISLVSLFSLTPSLSSSSLSSSEMDTKLLWVEEKEFLAISQSLGKTLYHQGVIVYYEAVNKEIAISHFQSEGIVVKRKATKESGISIAIHPQWLPIRYSRASSGASQGASQHDTSTEELKATDIVPTGKLYDLSENVAQMRRLVRVRKDTPTLSVRVLQMVSDMESQFKKRWELSLNEAMISDEMQQDTSSKRGAIRPFRTELAKL